MTGCTQYSSEKVENPPNTMARLMREKAAVPAEMGVIDVPGCGAGVCMRQALWWVNAAMVGWRS
jgi:hypothetical protein